MGGICIIRGQKGIKMPEDLYWLWLSKIKIGAITKIELLQKYEEPEIIFNEREKLQQMLTKGEYQEICKEEPSKLLKSLEEIEKYNIKIINIFHDYYPTQLKYIYDSPVVLFALGNIELLKQEAIAIVGARQCSNYGKVIAKEIAKQIVRKNINVVSGLARGIDSFAHIGAEGRTIAVLGSGLDIIYPKENIRLAKNILQMGGLIISEYNLGTPPDRMNFPNRNRIISGISNAVIVIEAKERSGSLITAEFALEQGKDVYAVPGNITSKYSIGTNNLIKEGAIPYTCIKDILE